MSRCRRVIILCVSLMSLLAGASAAHAANLSGAVLSNPGCSANRFQTVNDDAGALARLPFDANFAGIRRRELMISPNGWVGFLNRELPDEIIPIQYNRWIPFDMSGKVAGSAYVGNPDRETFVSRDWEVPTEVIAPFLADNDQLSPYNVSWGGTVFQGDLAFCVTWSEVRPNFWLEDGEENPVTGTNTFQMLIVDRSGGDGNGDIDIVFNYGSVQWDRNWATHDYTEAGSSWVNRPPSRGMFGHVPRVGFTNGAGYHYEMPGSGSFGTLIDSNISQNLIGGSLGSDQPGRYIFEILNRPGFFDDTLGFDRPGFKSRYAALGDSYQSGEGAVGDDDYNPGTDEVFNKCHRSLWSMPSRIQHQQLSNAEPAFNRNLYDEFDFRACSGATLADIWVRQYATEPKRQFDSVTPSTTFVTVGIGGNDMNFAKYAKKCVIAKCGIESHNVELEALMTDFFSRRLQPDGRWLNKPEQTLDLIRRYARPGARVVVVGYPRFFPANPVGSCLPITHEEQRWVNSKVHELNAQLHNSAAYLGLEYQDQTAALQGHELCNNNGKSKWMNNVVFPNVVESMHPNRAGQKALWVNFLTKRPMDSFAGSSSFSGSRAATKTVVQGSTQTHVAEVPTNRTTAAFRIAWQNSSNPAIPNSLVNFRVISPTGRSVNMNSEDSDVNVNIGNDTIAISIANPEAGEWTLEAEGEAVPDPEGVKTDFFVHTGTGVDSRPTADFVLTAESPNAISVDAAASISEDGEIAEYSWEFGDGTSADGQTASHQYDTSGEFSVSLTVVDTAGKSSVKTKTFTYMKPQDTIGGSPARLFAQGECGEVFAQSGTFDLNWSTQLSDCEAPQRVLASGEHTAFANECGAITSFDGLLSEIPQPIENGDCNPIHDVDIGAGVLARVDQCGAVETKNLEVSDAWTPLLPCGSARQVALAPVSESVTRIAVVTQCGGLWVYEDGAFNAWIEIEECGGVKSVALSGDRIVTIDSCNGASAIEGPVTGSWKRIRPCDSTRAVAANDSHELARMIFAIDECGRPQVMAGHLDENWQSLGSCGDAVSLVATGDRLVSVNECGAASVVWGQAEGTTSECELARRVTANCTNGGSCEATPDGPDTRVTEGPQMGTSIQTSEVAFEFEGDTYSADEQFAFECRLDDTEFSPCAGSVLFDELTDGVHVFEVRAIDRVGNVDATPATATFRVETAAPETTITHPEDGSSTMAQFVSLSMNASESDAQFECRVDTGEFEPCEDGVEFNDLADGEHTFAVRAIDVSGNIETTPAEVTVTVDRTDPVVTIEGPFNHTVSNDEPIEISWTVDEPLGHLECGLDGVWEECESPYVLPTLDAGEHTFWVAATDKAGNYGTYAGGSFTVTDSVAPDTTILRFPYETHTAGPDYEVTFESDDPLATFECRFDSDPFAPCQSPTTLSGQSTGSHWFWVRAVDQAGNADPTPDTGIVSIDSSGPVISIDGPLHMETDNRSVIFDWSSDEPVESFECVLDNLPLEGCSMSIDLSHIAVGRHTIEVTATDIYGNQSAPAGGWFDVLDVMPPESYAWIGDELGFTGTSGEINISSNEPTATFECRIDTSPFAACANPYEFTNLSDGPHTFEVRAIDGAGNAQQTASSREFSVDGVAPTIDVSGIGAGQVEQSQFVVTWTADEPVSAAICLLDGVPLAECGNELDLRNLSVGSHSLSISATDLFANTSVTPSMNFEVVDTLAPETTIVGGPSEGGYVDTSTSFEFSSDQAESTFECRLDEQPWAACESPYELNDLPIGMHVFEVSAVDTAGNRDESADARTFVVDPSPPDTSIDSGPDQGAGLDQYPMVLREGSGVTEVEAHEHTCFVQAGAVKCWGPNYSGQLGDGSVEASPSPVSVAGLTEGATAVTVGGQHSCGIVEGAAMCWGEGSSGQLGDGQLTSSNTPVAVSGLGTGVTSISAGPYYTCAVASGAVKCWGMTDEGQLGGGSGYRLESSPVSIAGLSADVTDISTSIQSACVVQAGAAKCWGSNAHNQLGNGTMSMSATPVLVTGLDSGVTSISSGQGASCALAAGAAKCWGFNGNGQLGNGNTAASDNPVDVVGLPGAVEDLAVGLEHTCAVSGGKVYCWGRNTNGAFGDGTFEDSSTPKMALEFADGASAVAAGQGFSCAVIASGLRCWNGYGSTIGTTAGAPNEATLSFSANRPAAFECSFDGSPFEQCESPVTMPYLAPGDHSLAVRAVDEAGRVDPTPAFRHFYWIEPTIPTVEVVAPFEGEKLDLTSTRIVLSRSDDVNEMQCALDGIILAECSSGMRIEGLEAGDHVLVVTVTDTSGYTSSVTRNFSVDLEPPDVTIDSGPGATAAGPVANFAFSSTDATARFVCRFDTAVYKACSSPLSSGPLLDGAHTFDLFAIDPAGNATKVSREFNFGPASLEVTIEGDLQDGSTTRDTTPTLEFSTTPAATVNCTIDGAGPVACSSPFELGPLAIGPHNVLVEAELAGETVSVLVAFEILPLVPETTITGGPAEGSITRPGVGYGFSSQISATFECRVDEEPFAECVAPYAIPSLESGVHTFSVRAVNSVGEYDESPASRTFELLPRFGVSLSDGVLTVTGLADRADFVNLRFSAHSDQYLLYSYNSGFEVDPNCVVTSNNDAECPAAEVERVEVFGLSGNDSINVEQATSDSVIQAPVDVFGGTGNDSISLRGTRDGAVDPVQTAYGEEGDDFMQSYPGTQSYFGGTGTDTVSYAVPRPTGVNVTLDATANDGSPGEQDLIGGDVERVNGTDHDDTLIGDDMPNRLSSMGGDDLLIGNLGADVFDAGTGTDTISYESHPLPVNVKLGSSAPKGHVGESDSVPYANVESVVGSPFNDVLEGDGSSNEIRGGAGDDSLSGFGGNDFIDGGAGIDTLNGGSGDDHLYLRDDTTDALADCGDDIDVARGDATDSSVNCEPAHGAVVATITAGPENGSTTNDQTPTFEFGASEPGAIIECRYGTAAFEACTSPYTSSALGDGNHTFSVRARDLFGYEGTSIEARTFSIDTSPPESSIVSGPANNALIDEATTVYGLSSDDVNATFECKVDFGEFLPCGSTWQTGYLHSGTHTIAVRAVDPVGNADPTPASRTVRVTLSSRVTVSPVTNTSSVDLTAVGALDWIAPKSADPAVVARKESTESPIGAVTLVGDAPVGVLDTAGTRTFAWSNGAPPFASSSASTDGIVVGGAQGRGVRFSIPASQAVGRVLRVYIGYEKTKVRLLATGATASSYGFGGPTSARTNATYDIKFRGVNTSDSVVVNWTQDSAAVDGKVYFYGAALFESPDVVPPDTSITSGVVEGGTVEVNRPVFSFASNESGSYFNCKIDGAAYTGCFASNYQTPVLSEGVHTLRVRALDESGNVDPTPVVRTFTVDLP